MAARDATPGPVLLVEDDADVRSAMVQVLKQENIPVEAVFSFEEALRFLERKVASVVISDLVRAGRPQWPEVEAIVKAAAPSAVVLGTAWLVKDAEAKARGITKILRKPFSLEALLGVIAEQAYGPVTDPAIVELVKRYFWSLDHSDWTLLGSLVTDDVVYHLPGNDPVHSRTVEGRAAFLAFSAETFAEFKDVAFQVEGVHRLGESIVASYSGQWGSGSGARRLEGAVLFNLDGQRIRRIGVRLDLDRITAH